MKTIFLLHGHFGVGKTSIVNFYPHKDLAKPFSEVHGLLSLGGPQGADRLSSWDYDKERVFTELLPKYKDRDILIHSMFYGGVQDVNRYQQTHRVVVIHLRTPYEVNKERLANRKVGARINNKSFIQFLKSTEKLRQFCVWSKAKWYRVDNARPLKTVAKEVWGIIDSERRGHKMASEIEHFGEFSPRAP